MTLLAHLEELRGCLTRCVIAAVVGFILCFAFAERLLNVLLAPLKGVLPPKSELIATTLTESIFVSMKVAFVAGLFVVSPYIFFQIWRFIAPGLYAEERKLMVPVAFFTALCFVSGGCFGYFIVFPFGFTFLANYLSDTVTLMPALKDYYAFSMSLLFAFGIIFEMPVFIFFLARLGVVDHLWLRQKRRWAIVVFFVVSAILTPTPDAVNQILMAAPMVVLYEVSIWVAYFFGKKKRAPETDDNLPEPVEDAEPPVDETAPSEGVDTPATEPEGPATASDVPADPANAEIPAVTTAKDQDAPNPETSPEASAKTPGDAKPEYPDKPKA